MADLDKALQENAYKPKEYPTDNIMTLNVKDSKSKAGISAVRISALARDSETPSKLLNGKEEIGDQFIFDNDANDGGKLILEDVDDDEV